MDAKRTGELIQNRRKQLDLSQKQLAERLDISPKTVSKWETGVSQTKRYKNSPCLPGLQTKEYCY